MQSVWGHKIELYKSLKKIYKFYLFFFVKSLRDTTAATGSQCNCHAHRMQAAFCVCSHLENKIRNHFSNQPANQPTSQPVDQTTKQTSLSLPIRLTQLNSKRGPELGTGPIAAHCRLIIYIYIPVLCAAVGGASSQMKMSIDSF